MITKSDSDFNYFSIEWIKMSEQTKKEPEYVKILTEIQQHHDTRKKYYERVESIIGMPVLSYFTSFKYPVAINDTDVVLFEDILQKMDVSKGLMLLINSPGGDGESAERIVKICRSNSGTNKFKCIVLGQAKSAATIICFGAEEIYMNETAELGPIDPQVLTKENEEEEPQLYSAHNLINTFKNLFNEAINTKGNVEPYLQQLKRFTSYDIAEFESWMELSKDIAIKLLKTGMLSSFTENEITKKIQKFLIPKMTKTHSRPIYANECAECDLKIHIIDKIKERELWKNIYRLYFRLHNLTNNMKVAKILENKDISLAVDIK